jgi:hypothetical protein
MEPTVENLRKYGPPEKALLDLRSFEFNGLKFL